MSELTIFAYPWDIARSGAGPFVAAMRELRATSIGVATIYHSAEVIVPMRDRAVVVSPEPNRAHLPLPEGTFTGLSAPPSSVARDHPGLFEDLAREASGHGIRMLGWTIAFHNSSLATAHPEAAIENCFGDRSAHALCPANPAAAAYLDDMLCGLARTGYFDDLLLESATYLLAGHGHPHELWGVRLDPVCRYLLSLCFCEHCRNRAGDAGIDADGLRAWAAAELHRTWNDPLSLERAPDDGLELASLLAARSDLYDYTRMRFDVVNRINRSARDRVRTLSPNGSRLLLGTAVWGRPLANNWLEGVDLAAWAEDGDQILIEAYYPETGDVARDIDHALRFAPPDRLSLVQTIWPAHHPGGLAQLLRKIEIGLESGIRSFGLYNYHMASEPTAAWAARVGRLLEDAP